MANELEKAYAAGIVDGEGCIGVYHHGPRSSSYELVVKIGMTEPQAVHELIANFGGRSNPYTNSNGPVHRAVFTGKRAYEFLKLVLPYLKVKRAQAEVAIEFFETCMGRQGFKLTEVDCLLRQGYEQRLKSMKKQRIVVGHR